jgi:hypothetical protein
LTEIRLRAHGCAVTIELNVSGAHTVVNQALALADDFESHARSHADSLTGRPAGSDPAGSAAAEYFDHVHDTGMARARELVAKWRETGSAASSLINTHDEQDQSNANSISDAVDR